MKNLFYLGIMFLSKNRKWKQRQCFIIPLRCSTIKSQIEEDPISLRSLQSRKEGQAWTYRHKILGNEPGRALIQSMPGPVGKILSQYKNKQKK